MFCSQGEGAAAAAGAGAASPALSGTAHMDVLYCPADGDPSELFPVLAVLVEYDT